jgi:hypothetical protein
MTCTKKWVLGKSPIRIARANTLRVVTNRSCQTTTLNLGHKWCTISSNSSQPSSESLTLTKSIPKLRFGSSRELTWSNQFQRCNFMSNNRPKNKRCSPRGWPYPQVLLSLRQVITAGIVPRPQVYLTKWVQTRQSQKLRRNLRKLAKCTAEASTQIHPRAVCNIKINCNRSYKFSRETLYDLLKLNQGQNSCRIWSRMWAKTWSNSSCKR